MRSLGALFLSSRDRITASPPFVLSVRRLVLSSQALNVIMNVLDKHYLDRDLNRSGNSVVMITAGPGVFNVDGKLSGKTRFFFLRFPSYIFLNVFSVFPSFSIPVTACRGSLRFASAHGFFTLFMHHTSRLVVIAF